jgi:adenylylsulfate kinase
MPSRDPRNLTWHHGQVTPEHRAGRLGQRGAALWLTGLSGSGKSTVAMALERRLVDAGRFAYVLDGDNVRHGLCGDLGFGEADRRENIRRVGHVARLFVDAGAIVAAAFISPFRADRDAVRALLAPGQFFEIHVATPIEVCESRDPKGLYRRARAGEIPDFTGISSPYEPPLAPELALDTGALSIDACVDALVGRLAEAGVVPR